MKGTYLDRLLKKIQYNKDSLEDSVTTHSLEFLKRPETNYIDQELMKFVLWTKKFVYIFHCSDSDLISVQSVPINPESANGYNFHKSFLIL